MSFPDFDRRQERPFQGSKVYFSGSINGVPNSDPELFHNLVGYMQENGADVLSEHVGGRNRQEMEEIRTRRLGFSIITLENPAPVVRRTDLKWVDEATHVVAVVDTASTGVGMELQRAFDKPRMGMNVTPVLCLVRQDIMDAGKVSFMVSGISEDDSPAAVVMTYKDTEDAKSIIADFLISHK